MGLGSTLVVGPKVMAYDDSGGPASAQAMNDEERRMYRELATGRDEEQPLLAAADPRPEF
jgi:hypothetical protein